MPVRGRQLIATIRNAQPVLPRKQPGNDRPLLLHKLHRRGALQARAHVGMQVSQPVGVHSVFAGQLFDHTQGGGSAPCSSAEWMIRLKVDSLNVEISADE